MESNLPRMLIFNNGRRCFSRIPSVLIMNELVRKTMQVGHKLTLDEINDDEEMFQACYYSEYFGSFEAAALKARQKALAVASR